MEPKVKLLIIGHARHGKDTLAAIMRYLYGFTYKGSSEAAAEIFIFWALSPKYGYKTFEDCYKDRVNHRAEWYDLICDYNRLDPARLAKEIMEKNNIYVGMRDDREIDACLKAGVFDLVIGVYNPREPEEPKDSFNINLWDKSDIVIPNTGTVVDLVGKASKLRLLWS